MVRQHEGELAGSRQKHRELEQATPTDPRKTGPVVRIGPNELDFSHADAAREIHKVGAGYLKSNWYRKLGYQGSETLFSTTNPKFHADRRRMLSGPISEQNVLKMEPLINERIYMAIARMEEEARTGTVDIFKWWTFMATDVIGELSFGESFRMLELGKVCVNEGLVRDSSNVKTPENPIHHRSAERLPADGSEIRLPFYRDFGPDSSSFIL